MKKNEETTRQRLLQHDRLFLDQGYRSLAGVDEAGRGPLAGPVVASAVIVRDFSFSSRVDDSKKMTEKARSATYEEILERCVVGIGVVAESAAVAVFAASDCGRRREIVFHRLRFDRGESHAGSHDGLLR